MKYVFVIMLTVFTALIAYVVIRGRQALIDMPCARNVYLAVTIAMYILLIGGMVISMVSASSLARIASFIGHTSLIIFLYLIISFLLVDIIRGINYFAHFAPEGMLIFRKWALTCSLGIILLVMLAGNYKFNHPKTVNLTIDVNGKTPQNKELRIVAASDIHLGLNIGKKRLRKYVELINQQQPDIVLLAGDITDNALAPVIKQNMNDDLREIKAPLGVYAVPGNHEYISRDIYGAIHYLQSAGIRVLRDSAELVNDSFYIVGRDDRTNPDRKSIPEIIEGIDRTRPVILLDHQPYHLEQAEENGIDLQISGHTHDGQFFPVNLIVRRIYENAHGYSTRGNTHYYVSSSLGIWGPQYRIGTQSELVVITLRY